MSRRAYLDWLRGVAVLIMIEAHTLDSWTREAERVRDDYKWSIVVGGFGAPIFLFLAGVALARGGLAPRQGHERGGSLGLGTPARVGNFRARVSVPPAVGGAGWQAFDRS